jgi:two-component system, response regulator PdtaR
MTENISVLVVEDEALVRMNIVNILEDEGFQVFEAANANQAIEMLIANPAIVAMFTDVDMPGGMDGLLLAATVRDRWPPIKIIVTSGHRNVDVEHLPIEARFIPKPYHAAKVARLFREMLFV